MKPKKSLGQNFLSDKKILTQIVDIGDISEEDTVLEIGPGTGNLTSEILKKNPKKIIVVEKDNNLSGLLKKKFGNKIDVINDDILNCYEKFNTNSPIIVFGNLPYNISSQILISFVKLKNLNKIFKKFIFVFQREVADRIVAKENTKNYGRLTILVSWKMKCEKILDIDPNYFYPKPKVWSSLITLIPKREVRYLKKPEHLEHVTNIFFNKRRKMIKNPMKQLFKNYETIAKDINLELNLRPQNISKQKFFELCEKYEKLLR